LRIRDVLTRIQIPNFFILDPGSRNPDPSVHKNRDEK
jgi:hypothetical protein